MIRTKSRKSSVDSVATSYSTTTVLLGLQGGTGEAGDRDSTIEMSPLSPALWRKN